MTKPTKNTSPVPAALPTPLSVGTLMAIPLPNGRYAAVWVLGIGEAYRVLRKLVKEQVHFLVLEGTWPNLPSAAEVAGQPLSASHDSDIWKGVFWGEVPSDFVLAGVKDPTSADLARMTSEGPMVFQNAEHLRSELFRHFRLEHDRAAVEDEWRQAEEARARREAQRHASLTLPEMLREKPFAHWRSHWPAKIVREAQTIFAEATTELIALDAVGAPHGGTKRQRATILKRIVTRFNALYDREGCIETGEASDVIARLEDLASLVGLSNADEALSGHRDW